MPGRYTILGSIAQGGMGKVYLARMTGSAGFSRPVAIKRLHRHLAAERNFVAMLVDEARLAAQIRHTNVIDTLDLVVSDGAMSLVLEYVEGESLSALVGYAKAQGERVPRPIALSILYGVLRGLDAAHEARSPEGQPLGIVHRDVSPQNVLVGVDGIPRIIDFGVAKALGRIEATRPGEVRGKFGYMAPEQALGRPVTRQSDVYSAGVVLWELLTGERLFPGSDIRTVASAVLRGQIPPPSSKDPSIPPELDAVVLRATKREVGERYLTAREMLADLEPFERASDDEVGAWVRRLAAKPLAERQRLLSDATPPTDNPTIEDLMAELARSRSLSDETEVMAKPPARAEQTPSLAGSPAGSYGGPQPPSHPIPPFGSAPRVSQPQIPLGAPPDVGVAVLGPPAPSKRGAAFVFALGFAGVIILAIVVGAVRRSTAAAPPTPASSAVLPSPAPVPSPDPEPAETSESEEDDEEDVEDSEPNTAQPTPRPEVSTPAPTSKLPTRPASTTPSKGPRKTPRRPIDDAKSYR